MRPQNEPIPPSMPTPSDWANSLVFASQVCPNCDLARRTRQEQAGQIPAGHDKSLVRIMDMLYRCKTLDEAISVVLKMCQAATGAGVAVLLRLTPGDDAETLATGTASFGLPQWPEGSRFMSAPRRVGDLAQTAWMILMPETARGYRSLLSVPVKVTSGPPLALVLLAIPQAAFSRLDSTFLHRVVRLLELSTDRLQRSDTNPALGRAGASLDDDQAALDGSFATLRGANDSLAEWQGRITEVTSALIWARRDAVDAAITEALTQTGKLANVDRTYVFPHSPSNPLISLS